MVRKVYCESLGKYLELPERCERIVSFSPSVTEAFFEMELWGKIIGVSSYCVRPERARKEKKVLGSYSTCKIDELRKLNPDIIFTTSGYQLEFARKMSEEFNVYTVRLPSNLADVIATCVEVGVVAGYPEKARELEIKLFKKLSELTNERQEQNKKQKVYVEIDLGGPITFGAYSYITDILWFSGLKNIFSEEPAEWLRPNDEKIREINPEIIIYEPKMFSKRRDRNEIKERLFERFGEIEAIRKDMLFITPGIYDFLAHHGPSLIYEVIPWIMEIKKTVKNKEIR